MSGNRAASMGAPNTNSGPRGLRAHVPRIRVCTFLGVACTAFVVRAAHGVADK